MTGIIGSIVAPIAGSIVGGLLGDKGGSEQQSQVTNEPWAGIVPYLVGSTPGLAYTQGERPINQDWLAWNYYASQGLPVGPPPPMFLDDPRYTGENVFEAPFTYREPMNNLGFGDPFAEYGATPGGMGTINPNPYGNATNLYDNVIAQQPAVQLPSQQTIQYPSQQTSQQVAPQAPAVQEPVSTPAPTSQRYSPWLGRMVGVGANGRPIEDPSSLLQEANQVASSLGLGRIVQKGQSEQGILLPAGASSGTYLVDLWTSPDDILKQMRAYHQANA